MIFLTIKTELSHRLQNTDTVQPVRIPHIPPMHKSKKFLNEEKSGHTIKKSAKDIC